MTSDQLFSNLQHLTVIPRPKQFWAAILLLILFCCHVQFFVTNASADMPLKKEKNREEVKLLVKEHCDVIGLVFAEANDTQILKQIDDNHRELVNGIRADFSVLQWFERLHSYYSTVEILSYQPTLSEQERQLIAGTVRNHSTLVELFQDKKANCFSLSLLYYIHSRLADIEIGILLIPRHVMLYVPDCSHAIRNKLGPDGARQRNKRIFDFGIYDPVINLWLGEEEILSMQKMQTCILDKEKIIAATAYNLGTSLSKGGDICKGTVLLEKAYELGYPLKDVLKNLCINYFKKGNYKEIINVVESEGSRSICRCTDQLKISPMIDPTGKGNPSVMSVNYDINRLYFYSLLRTNKKAQAVSVAEKMLFVPGVEQDRNIYKIYSDIKSR